MHPKIPTTLFCFNYVILLCIFSYAESLIAQVLSKTILALVSSYIYTYFSERTDLTIYESLTFIWHP